MRESGAAGLNRTAALSRIEFTHKIPSVNDTEIRKQLSKMGRNKACELDNLLIEAIIMVAELNLLLKDYTAEDNGKWYPR